MSMEHNSAMCHPCKRQVRCSRQTPNHIFHLLFTAMTGGLWAFVWLFAPSSGWTCCFCGTPVQVLTAKAQAKPKELPVSKRNPWVRQ